MKILNGKKSAARVVVIFSIVSALIVTTGESIYGQSAAAAGSAPTAIDKFKELQQKVKATFRGLGGNRSQPEPAQPYGDYPQPQAMHDQGRHTVWQDARPQLQQHTPQQPVHSSHYGNPDQFGGRYQNQQQVQGHTGYSGHPNASAQSIQPNNFRRDQQPVAGRMTYTQPHNSSPHRAVVQAQYQEPPLNHPGYQAVAEPLQGMQAQPIGQQLDYSYDGYSDVRGSQTGPGGYPVDAGMMQASTAGAYAESGWPHFRYNDVEIPTATQRANDFASENIELRRHRQRLLEENSKLQKLVEYHKAEMNRAQIEIAEARRELESANGSKQQLTRRITELENDLRVRELETTRMLDAIGYRLDDLIMREMTRN